MDTHLCIQFQAESCLSPLWCVLSRREVLELTRG